MISRVYFVRDTFPASHNFKPQRQQSFNLQLQLQRTTATQKEAVTARGSARPPLISFRISFLFLHQDHRGTNISEFLPISSQV